MTKRRNDTRFARRVGASVVLSVTLFGCSKRSDAPVAAASVSGSTAASSVAPIAPPRELPAPVASGVPIDPKVVSDAVNPFAKPAYSGPTGIVEGRVLATGDPSMDQPEIAKQIPEKCGKARPFYAKLFREGPGRTLADVLVAVTGYRDYVPARAPAQRFVAKDCTFETRTIALTFGQKLEVVSGDNEAYVTDLIGERGQAQIVATPGGEVPSTHYPTRAGRFVLIDNLRLFMTAEVLVLKYATVDVTGIDGRYRIEGLPPGNVRLSAMLPSTGGTVERAITVEAGKTQTLDLQIPFDEKAYRLAMAAQKADAGAPDAGSVTDAGGADAARSKAPAKSAPSAASAKKP
jgi:hypothetical protein